MREIGRSDAVLAIKLWGLAEHRYFPAFTDGTVGPTPAELYVGLRGDAVNVVLALAEEMINLALEWDAWEARQPQDVHLAHDEPRTCPRKAT